MLGRLNVGSGSKINGLIEEYVVASDGNVNVGDFVKFVNRQSTELSSETYSGKPISAVMLSSDKVFIAHSSNVGSLNYLYGLICTIDGITITTGTDTQLSSSDYSGDTISAVVLSPDKVFIAHSNIDMNSFLYGLVCTIDGTTITKGTDTVLVSSSYAGDVISAIALSSDKVFVAHRYGSNSTRNLYGLVCTINGTSITKGTDTQLSSVNWTGFTISAVMLSSDRVFIAHSYGSNSTRNLYGLVCTINGTSITKGTDTQLSSVNWTGFTISAVMLSSDRVFIAHSYSDYYLYGLVCTINGTNITKGIDTELSSVSNLGKAISVVMLSPDKIFIAHSDDDINNSGHLYGLVCTINGITINKGTDIKLNPAGRSGCVISAVALSPDRIFIAHSLEQSCYLYGVIHTTYGIIKTVENPTDTIIGVTKTKGTSGQTVKVVVPNFEESEMN